MIRASGNNRECKFPDCRGRKPCAFGEGCPNSTLTGREPRDPRYPLTFLASLIDWERFAAALGPLYRSGDGRTARTDDAIRIDAWIWLSRFRLPEASQA
jgi:hypothetical protein